MKKRHYFWFLLLIIPMVIFDVFAGVFLKKPCKAEWLELSLSTSLAVATIILGVMVYIQAEKHKASAEEDRQQDLIIKTSPYVVFKKIEYANIAKDIISVSETSVDTLRYFGEKENNELSEEEFAEKYNYGLFFRFIFSCPIDKGLNNIIFNEVCVYPQYPDGECYRFLNKKGKLNTGNISLLEDSQYQVGKYFMFPNDENSFSCSLAKKFQNDLIGVDKKIFFNIKYMATNIYGIKVSGELKFFITASLSYGKEKIVFEEPDNVSNWLEHSLFRKGKL